MRNQMRRGIAVALMATALLLGAIACSTSVVSKDEVATTASRRCRNRASRSRT